MAITTNFTEAVKDLVTSLTAAEKLNFSEAIFTKSVEASPLTQDHTVVTGVRHGNLVPIIDNQTNYESFPFSDPNQCAVPECDLGHNYSTNKWELGLIECKVPICLKSFEDDFLLFWNQYKMVQTDHDKNENDYIQSALVQFLYNQFKNNHTGAQWRGGYFGDKASASSLFNGIDGWFTQAEANASQVVTIAENSGGTYAAQQLTGERIYEILKEMYLKYAEQDWMDDAALEFRMSKRNAMALATYFTFLDDKKCCADLQILSAERVAAAPYDYMRLTFKEIPIKVMPEWDAIINRTTELNPGWVGGKMVTPTAARVNPNRILLTYKTNLLLGTQEQSNLAFFDIWHSQDDDKVYMKGGSYFGTSIPVKTDYILAI